MENYSKYKRGSEWRKWDLHVHTASSYDAYRGADANELLAKAWIDNEFAAVAITDHFLIDAARIKALRLLVPNLTIFPGVELRTDKGASNLHVIMIFSEKMNVDTLSENFRVIMINQKAKAKESDDTIYWDFNDVLEFAHINKGFISLHTGSKTQGMDNVITNAMPINMAIKTEIAKHTHFYEIGKTDDIQVHIEKIFPHIGFKPLILCSDNHDPRNYTTKENLWIKSDPTFEGLQQLIYEPQERVSIQENKPEEKRGYYAIDSITLNEAGFWNQTIYFNENLNTIIGGRATGKSTLLSCLAQKGGASVDKGFITSHSANLQIKWKDGEIDKQRDIDFFPQSYMFDIASDSKKRDELIERIIADYDTNKYFETYKAFITTNKNQLSESIRNLFNIQSEISVIRNNIKQKGDKQGIETELKNINERISKSKVNISDEELAKYKEISRIIFEKESRIKVIDNDINQIKYISNQPIFNASIQYSFSSLSENFRQSIIADFEIIRKEADEKWKVKLITRESDINQEKVQIIEEIKLEKDKDAYKLGLKVVESNKQYQELTERLKAEQTKFNEIKTIEEQLKVKLSERNALKTHVINQHLEFKNQIAHLKRSLSLSSSGIEINPKIFLSKDLLKDFLSSRLNQQGKERQDYINNFCDNYLKNTEFESSTYLDKALNNNIDYKSGNSNQEVTVELLSSNWFDVSFDLKYQSDAFQNMSQGKQAFVILKLLLEFSKKECPILIDQPEDSLDNRAIYNELVKYLMVKKKERQIILVTHNSNVVVSADAEQIIVANQHGEKTLNKDNYKFQYVSGGLEFTKIKDNSNNFTLLAQGIREHVCEILEGGNEAFKKREQKYGIKD
jgi:ABC-type cobalamin/Fe3+-siderophores transport system ATPase subunit